MAITSLAIQEIAVTGTVPTFTPANADGHKLAVSGGGAMLIVDNGGGSPITVTQPTPQSHASGASFTPPAASVAAGTIEYVKVPGGFPFQQSDGTVHVTFSGVTDVDVAAIRL